MRKNKNNNLILIIVAISEILLFRAASIYDNNILQTIVIVLNTIITTLILLRSKNKEDRRLNIIISLSLLIRTALLFFDIYTGKGLFTGKDTEVFYECAQGIKNGYNSNSYSIFLYTISGIIGSNRLSLQYLNIIASFVSMLYLKKTLYVVDADNKKKTIAMALFCLGPISMSLSAVLLRESLMIAANAVSMYFFIRWYSLGEKRNLIKSFILAIFSIWLHSGMILILFAYAICFVIYSPERKRISFRKNTITYLVIISIFLVGIFAVFGGSLMKYFEKYENLESTTMSSTKGGSDYLPFLKNSSLSTMILFIPIKSVYFYLSPMLWDVRNMGHLLTALLSSSIYIYLFYGIFKKTVSAQNLKILLLIILVPLTLMYAWGVSNAGTAMRHREKMLPFIAITYAITKNRKVK